MVSTANQPSRRPGGPGLSLCSSVEEAKKSGRPLKFYIARSLLILSAYITFLKVETQIRQNKVCALCSLALERGCSGSRFPSRGGTKKRHSTKPCPTRQNEHVCRSQLHMKPFLHSKSSDPMTAVPLPYRYAVCVPYRTDSKQTPPQDIF